MTSSTSSYLRFRAKGAGVMTVLSGALIFLFAGEASAQSAAQLQAQINLLNSRVAATDSRVSVLNSRVTSTDLKVSTVASRVASAETKINSLTLSAGSLATRVSNLEADARRCSNPNQFQLMYDSNGGVLQIDACGRVARTYERTLNTVIFSMLPSIFAPMPTQLPYYGGGDGGGGDGGGDGGGGDGGM